MTIEFNCHACGKLLRTSDDKAGKTANCPGCGEKITVPGAGGEFEENFASDEFRAAADNGAAEFDDYDDYDDYGAEQYEPAQQRRGGRSPRSGRQNTLATISLITGASGLLMIFPAFCCGCLFFLSLPLDVTAIITGAIALNQIAHEGEEGKPMAIAGLVCGISSIVFFVALLALGVAVNLQQPNQFRF